MITVVSWLWTQEGKWSKYRPHHVYRLKDQIERNTTIPHKFVCITDGSLPLEGITTHPLQELGLSSKTWTRDKRPQCFNRLWMFSKEAGELLGDSISIDLDVQITDNIDSVLTRQEDFVINQGNPKVNGLSGSMWKLNAGAKTEVWEELNQNDLDIACGLYKGSDQAWIRWLLGEDVPKYRPEDGVYHYHYITKKPYLKTHPPEGCKMMFFAGRIKPEDLDYKWIE